MRVNCRDVIPDPRAARARGLRFSPGKTVDGDHPSTRKALTVGCKSAFGKGPRCAPRGQILSDEILSHKKAYSKSSAAL